MSEFYKKIKSDKESLLKELFTYLKQPSISVSNKGIDKMASMVEKTLKDLGAKTKRLRVGKSYPFIYAEIGKGDKTLLIYNHYDVQPSDPLDEWKSPPFTPTIRTGKIFARGVSDNKGDLILRIQAIRYILEKYKRLPIKIKFLIEGEEEIGSPNLEKLSEKYGYLWKDADICVWEVGEVDENGKPKMDLGYKGIVYIELSCELGTRDSHSGNASYIDSAVWRLIHALTTLRDIDGEIKVKGLNKLIKPPTPKEREIIKNREFNYKDELESLDRETFLGNRKDKEEVLLRHNFGGTCNICGIWAGFTEPGKTKTIIPNKATAKIDFRMVVNQTSKQVLKLLRKHLDDNGFSDIKITHLLSEPVSKTDINNPILQKVLKIIEKSYGKKINLGITCGGSGPAYHVANKYNIPVFGLGCGYPDNRIHAPNENIRIKDYLKAIDATCDVIEHLDNIIRTYEKETY